ncbi:hypothetical protein NHX12_033618 [Muraenolepis orangiensis]|uniref:Transcriptional protein SWT1 n=1 Tax=Muraenolepis orangiensis TaxID=630683 RepID=A0A9Q0E2N9_9TELE|nr:hypothetical protein NHX12_033618 [Muraenolepis orangiensis]
MWEMPKHKKNKKSKRLSSSTSGEDEKKSKAQGGWKPLSKPHEDKRGDPPAGKSSISAPWQRTTKQTSSASTTPAASECKPKLPTLAKRLYPAPGSLGGSLTPSRPAVAEVLLRAPGQSRLQVWCDVVPSYGELTQMDTDDGETDTFEHNCIVVLDTNILLSHLDYVKKIRSHGLGGMGFAMLLVPWVVLQELDAQKNTNRPEGSVAHLATPAIHFIYSCLKSLEPRLWGQSMQQASEGNRHLNAENNDDRILQCCLQYQILCPESALILCTNDKNLCSKALLSGVKALCKAELEEEKQAPTKAPTCDGGEEAVAQRRRVSQCVQLLENCLKEALSHILEVEMKAAYDDLWEDIVFVKQPWELLDVLKCIKKHWIAVFGDIFPRNRLHTVVTLLKFFTPALREAEELLEVFGKTKEKYGGRVSTTLDSLATIERQLLAQVSHQDVWALFENIWDNVCQMSSAVFAALHFDPGTMRRTGPEGSLPPPLPEDALACLHKLLPMVIELLQGFSRVLSSDMGMEESQALLSFIHASQLTELKVTLEQCSTAVSQSLADATW